MLHVSHLRHDDLARFVRLVFKFVTQHQLIKAAVFLQRLKGQKAASVHRRLKHIEVGGDFGPVKQGLVVCFINVLGEILEVEAKNETVSPFENIRTQRIVLSVDLDHCCSQVLTDQPVPKMDS